MNIDSIQNGYVIDHITAGKAMQIYNMLDFASLDCPVAMIMNVHSSKMGKKDIIKIDGEVEINLEVIGYISPDSTVNVIKNGEISGKSHIAPPEKLIDIIKCKNPRCITVTEHYVKPNFILVDKENALYRCEYCDTLYKAGETPVTVENN